MRKTIFFLLLPLLLIPFVFAGTVFWGSDQKYGNETFSRAGIADELNWSVVGCSLSSSMLFCTGVTSKAIYINQMPNVSTNNANWSAEWKGKLSGCSANGYNYASFIVANNSGNSMSIHITDGGSNNLCLRDDTSGQCSDIPNAKADDTLNGWKVVIGNQEVAVYINGTWQVSRTWTGGQIKFVVFREQEACQSYYDNFTAYNTSVYPSGVVETTPPNITYYNLTNGDGCENWNTDKTNACVTSSLTPTIQFNTTENAWCRISGNSSSTAGMNYSDMGDSRTCTGAAAGEGTTSHLCTLTNQDQLVYDVSYIYISCRDSYGNQNATSTSGPLSVNITGLEATSRDSIELGIANALVNSYSTYTGQKIYARNSANTQQLGTFDKVAKKLGKIWAFNWIGASESHVNMFNITPVLYTMEVANKTQTYIQNQTALLINSTK